MSLVSVCLTFCCLDRIVGRFPGGTSPSTVYLVRRNTRDGAPLRCIAKVSRALSFASERELQALHDELELLKGMRVAPDAPGRTHIVQLTTFFNYSATFNDPLNRMLKLDDVFTVQITMDRGVDMFQFIVS